MLRNLNGIFLINLIIVIWYSNVNAQIATMVDFGIDPGESSPESGLAVVSEQW